MLTDAGEAAFERYWPPLNQRRAELIRAEPLPWRERKELHCLERAADVLLEMAEIPWRSVEDFCEDPTLCRRILANIQAEAIARRQAEWKAEVLC